MHRSRINGLLIDCKTDDIDAASQFWADALGRPVDMKHPGTRGNYRMLATPVLRNYSRRVEFRLISPSTIRRHSAPAG